jgi:hypothetical protein
MHSLAALSLIIISQLWEPGATGYTFVKLGIGVRPVAMGNAFTAISDDGNAVFWNPSGLGIVGSYYATGMAMNHLDYWEYYNLTSAVPLGKNRGTIGFGLSYLTATDIEYSERGEIGDEFRNSDMLLNIGYGKAFGKKKKPVMALGASVKVIRSQLYTYSTYGVLADIGILINVYRYLYFGTVVKHVGTPRKFIERLEYPPINFRQGLAVKIPFWDNMLTLGFDYSIYPDVSPTFSAGGEIRIRAPDFMASLGQDRFAGFAIMAGYQSGYEAGAWSGFSAGFSVELVLAQGLYLDIAALLLSYGYLGSSERLSLGVNYVPTTGAPRK